MKITQHSEKKKHFFSFLSGFWSEERNLSVILGLIVFDFFVLTSLPGLIGEKLILKLLNNLVFSFLLLFGVLALTRHKSIQCFFALIVALIVIVRWMRLITGLTWLAEWDIILSIISSSASAFFVGIPFSLAMYFHLLPSRLAASILSPGSTLKSLMRPAGVVVPCIIHLFVPPFSRHTFTVFGLRE